MGFFVYDNRCEIPMEDRTLAHLQIVVIDKLRRREKFAMNVVNGRTMVTVWLNAYSPVMFV